MKLKFISIFLFVISCLYLVLNYEKEQKIDRYLVKKSELFNHMYEVNYNNFKQRSKIIYDYFIQNSEILDIYKTLQNADEITKDTLRDKLYTILKPQYDKLKYTNLKQLHFHLKNNESFLRMHKSNKYGDNLTGIREDITFVNNQQKPVHGFEMGRVTSGLRFVYPLFDESKNHLGSVEVSFDISAFTSEFMDHFRVLCNFHLDGKVLEKKAWKESLKEYYIKSPLDGYYLEKKNSNVLKKYIKEYGYNVKLANKNTFTKAQKNIQSDTTVSIYDKCTKSVITFLPIVNNITNEVVAFFTIRSYEDYIGSKTFNFYIILVGSILFLGVIFFLLYKDSNSKENINSKPLINPIITNIKYT